ncbi:hypothetical protein FOA52_013699 [Chlamydomonas sp. UWO 241]|nr:hypothetical protein FOA52_013699 [Chlamydomonas sp. UWO 241]
MLSRVVSAPRAAVGPSLRPTASTPRRHCLPTITRASSSPRSTIARASSSPEPPGTTEEPEKASTSSKSGGDPTPEPTPVADLAKEAWEKLNSESLDTKGVLGDKAYGMLSEALGEQKMASLVGFTDGVLKNRRALTVASAVLDVALILAGIKGCP